MGRVIEENGKSKVWFAAESETKGRGQLSIKLHPQQTNGGVFGRIC